MTKASRLLSLVAEQEEEAPSLPLIEGHVELHPGQIAALMSESPITVVLAGIRGGKTHVGALKSILYAIDNPCSEDECHLICSPTFPMSKVPVEKIFKLLNDKSIFPVNPLVRFVKSERTFILTALDGRVSKLRIVSLHDPDKIRGLKALSAWLDEAAYITKEAWDIVQGRLADAGGPCWITTTPAGYNWVFDLYERARAEERDGVPRDEREVRVVHFSSLMNKFVSRAGFERLLRGFDSRTYQQEVEAMFVRARGLIYHAFSRRKHVKPVKFDARLPVWVGQDFNVDPMASVIAQPFVNRAGEKGARVFAERVAPDSNTHDLAAFFVKWCEERKVPRSNVTFFADASGRARSTTGKSDFAIITQAGFRVDAPMANPFVKDRINCVNGLLQPFHGAPRMEFDPGCVKTIESLEKQIWEPESDPPEPDKEHGFDHTNDALGYLCTKKWPLRRGASLGTQQVKRAA